VKGFQAEPGFRSERGGSAESVAIGIASQDQIGADLLGAVDDDVENGWVFGIGNVAGNIRKIAVGF